MMSALRKSTKIESAAYAAMTSASAAVVSAAMTPGIGDAELSKLRRRAAAYRTQWEAAARRLEEVTMRATEREYVR